MEHTCKKSEHYEYMYETFIKHEKAARRRIAAQNKRQLRASEAQKANLNQVGLDFAAKVD